MKILIIFNNAPYENGDVNWNGLRLADTLNKTGNKVTIFLMNDAVDMARDLCKPPVGYAEDLVEILKRLISEGIEVKVCGTCMSRCGVYKNEPYFDGAEKSTMSALAELVVTSDKVISF